VVGFFCSEVEPLPWVEPECCSSAWNVKNLARLVVRLGRVRLLSVLFPEVPEARVSRDTFTVSFPVLSIYSLDEFPEAGKSVWLFMVDHVVFDMFGESIVSLSAECCLAPLTVCG